MLIAGSEEWKNEPEPCQSNSFQIWFVFQCLFMLIAGSEQWKNEPEPCQSNSFYHLKNIIISVDSGFLPPTELARFHVVSYFTTPRHFVRSHASSFTNTFFLIIYLFLMSISAVLCYPSFQFQSLDYHIFFFPQKSNHDRTTACYLL